MANRDLAAGGPGGVARVSGVTTPSPEVRVVLAFLDQAYDHQSWHGTNLRGSLRRVSVEQAAWRPAPQRHNIWETAVHAAYWKYTAWRRLTGTARGSFPLKGSNWFRRPEEMSERAWRTEIALLDRTHAQLREAVAGLSSRGLHVTPAGSKVSNLALLSGVAAHDFYHAGQIQLLKRLSAAS
jgi:uncharacterized damage-inducible protein DinB